MQNLQANELWRKTLTELKKVVSKPSYETWLTPTKTISLENETLNVSTPDKLTKDWLEERYTNFITSTLEKFAGKPIAINFVIEDTMTKSTKNQEIKFLSIDENEEEKYYDSNLNPRYTFDTFVIGAANRFAHAASLAVAESPAKAYNPLFIYGGVGLGKTHLMHAIGDYVQKQWSNKRVVYISSEKFTNDFINAILDNESSSFRNKYREADVLLIDDIQFLAKKEQTQEEFFHTFNTLHESDKQIVISSDRHPKEIPTLEERLRSRFEWGLITDIYPPDLETRIAILRKKSIADNLDIPSGVLSIVASKVDTNIRELEGALIRVVAYSTLQNEPISKSLAEEALANVLEPRDKGQLSIQYIQNKVAAFYNINPADLLGKKRSKQVTLPRQIAMYLCRELTELSLPKIGQDFGGRDHSTVMHSCEKINKALQDDPELNEAILEIKRNF